LAFLTQNKAKLCKILIITLVLEKNANFFAENRRKSQKIVIITSTPDGANFRPLGHCVLWAVFFSSTQNDNAMTTALQCINSLKPYTLAGFEPWIFCSVGAMTTMPRLHPWQLCQFSKKLQK
jgi:hypothetical protein